MQDCTFISVSWRHFSDGETVVVMGSHIVILTFICVRSFWASISKQKLLCTPISL